MQQQDILFEEIVVAGNTANLLQMYRLTRDRRVPVCARDNQVVVGYNIKAPKKLIA